MADLNLWYRYEKCPEMWLFSCFLKYSKPCSKARKVDMHWLVCSDDICRIDPVYPASSSSSSSIPPSSSRSISLTPPSYLAASILSTLLRIILHLPFFLPTATLIPICLIFRLIVKLTLSFTILAFAPASLSLCPSPPIAYPHSSSYDSSFYLPLPLAFFPHPLSLPSTTPTPPPLQTQLNSFQLIYHYYRRGCCSPLTLICTSWDTA